MTGGSGTPRRRGVLVLAVAAVLLLAAGTVLATTARPLRTLTASTQASGTAGPPLLLAPPALLRSHPGPVVVRARGDGTVLVAVGRADDVVAWARGAATTTASRLEGDDGIATTTAAGDGQVPDPAGSDLWTDQARGTGSAELTVDPAGGDTAVLVASDGSGPAPGTLQLTWTDRPVPLAAWGLLGAGALLLAVVGAVVGAGRRGRPVWRWAAPVPVVIDLRDVPPAAALDEPDAGVPVETGAELESVALRRPRGRRRSER